MGAVAAIALPAALAAGGTTYAITSSNKARKDAQGAADLQARQQTAIADREKATEQAAQNQKQLAVVAASTKTAEQNAGGYSSTIATSPSGLTGVAVTGGTKTILGS